MLKMFSGMKGALAIVIRRGRGSTLSAEGGRRRGLLGRGHLVHVEATRRVRVSPISPVIQGVLVRLQALDVFLPKRHLHVFGFDPSLLKFIVKLHFSKYGKLYPTFAKIYSR